MNITYCVLKYHLFDLSHIWRKTGLEIFGQNEKMTKNRPPKNLEVKGARVCILAGYDRDHELF